MLDRRTHQRINLCVNQWSRQSSFQQFQLEAYCQFHTLLKNVSKPQWVSYCGLSFTEGSDRNSPLNHETVRLFFSLASATKTVLAPRLVSGNEPSCQKEQVAVCWIAFGELQSVNVDEWGRSSDPNNGDHSVARHIPPFTIDFLTSLKCNLHTSVIKTQTHLHRVSVALIQEPMRVHVVRLGDEFRQPQYKSCSRVTLDFLFQFHWLIHSCCEVAQYS